MLKFIPKEKIKNKICVVVGTRPGIIKMSPIIRELHLKKIPYFILHTGQHYSPNMSQNFFEDLELPQPKYYLETVKNFTTHASQTAEMMRGCEEIFLKEKPKIVVVGGDANTNLSGAIAARKLGLIVAHVEAGLRSYDWRMPEEHNRVMIDHISEILFPPSEKAKDNLLKENVRGKIFVVGNTIVDATFQNLEIAKKKAKIINKLGLKQNNYFVLTLHREENVDDRFTLVNILEGIKQTAEKFKMPIIFPIHPRTKKRIKEFSLQKKLDSIADFKVIEPVGYLDFLSLLSNARLVLTDSGGVQEESCILKVPCVTLRENTERPETIKVGSNIIAGTNSEQILKSVEKMLFVNRDWINPFGDGTAGKKITNILIKAFNDKLGIPS